MIVVDIETSGVFPEKNGIIQIGAYEIESKKEFFGQCRIDDDEEVMKGAPKAIGKKMKPVTEVVGLTEEEMRGKKKQTQEQLLKIFFKWVKECETRNVGCLHPQFDLTFIQMKARKHDLEIPLSFRAFDLHSIAQSRKLEIGEEMNVVDGISKQDLTSTLEFCGMKDEREEHNALEDAMLEAECFSRLLYGKNLIPEFKKFPIPEKLKK